MRIRGRLVAIITMLAVSCLPLISWAQSGYTTVTAIVQDPSGNIYSNAPFTVSFYDPGTSGKLPTLNRSPFQQTFVGIQTDSFGNLSVTVADNNAIAATSGATGTQWRFNVCAQAGTPCFSTLLTISGATQDITAALKAAAAPISLTVTAPANTVNAGPVSGPSGPASYRALVAADILPIDLSSTNVNGGVKNNLAVSHLCSGSGASSATFLRGDCSWAVPSGSSSINSGTTGNLASYASSSIIGDSGLAAGSIPSLITTNTFTLLQTMTTGIKSPLFTTSSVNPSVTGVIRLSSSDIGLCWRSAANNADDCLTKDGTNNLLYTGTRVPLITDKLSVFAATSSADLAGVISNETGTGSLVFGTSPSLASISLSGTHTGASSFSGLQTFTGGIGGLAASSVTIPGDVSTASTSYVDVSGSDLTFTSRGGKILLTVNFGGHADPGETAQFTYSLDGGSAGTVMTNTSANAASPLSFSILIQPAAGVHTITLQMQAANGIGNVYCDPSQIFSALNVIEVSH